MLHLRMRRGVTCISISFAPAYRRSLKGIDDEHYRPGTFRDGDDVHVVNSAGDIVHTPPPAIGLTKRLQSIIEWVNTEHDSVESPDFLRPLIKAIVLHFCIGSDVTLRHFVISRSVCC